MPSYRNDSVNIFSHWDSFLPDISTSILKSNYAKHLARSIYKLVDKIRIEKKSEDCVRQDLLHENVNIKSLRKHVRAIY